MDSDSKMHLDALRGIRDRVLLLSIGNAFLCETPFLMKTGRGIAQETEELRNEIDSLKKRFPGKFKAEVETTPTLDDLQRMALRLENPDEEIAQKCTVGALGQEMEALIGALAQAVEVIRAQVEGKPPALRRGELFLHFLGRLNPLGFLPHRAVSFIGKGFIFLIVASCIAFGYLYLTMEKEDTLLREIGRSEADLRSRHEVLAALENQRAQLSGKIEEQLAQDRSRKATVGILDLQVEVQKLDEKRYEVMSEIDAHKNGIMEKQGRIKDLKGKSFLTRLLRR